MQHRPGRLKQKNKPHSRHTRDVKGRVPATRGSLKTKAVPPALSRQKQLNARRKQIRNAALLKRRIGSRHGPPKIIAIVALSGTINVLEIKKSILDGLQIHNDGSIVQTIVITHPQRSRLSLLCVRRDTRSTLDAGKVADLALFAINPLELLDAYGRSCLQLLRAQGMPSHMILLMQTRRLKKREKTRFSQFCRQEFPTDPKCIRWSVPSPTPVALFRALVETTANPLNWRDFRPYMLVQQCRFTPSPATTQPPPSASLLPPAVLAQRQAEADEFRRRMAELGDSAIPPPPSVVAAGPPPGAGPAAAAAAGPGSQGQAPVVRGTLEVRGYLRGRRLTPNQLIHIVNYGTYRPLEVSVVPDPHPLTRVTHERPPAAADDDIEVDIDVDLDLDEADDIDMLDDAQRNPAPPITLVNRPPPRYRTHFPTPGQQETLQESVDPSEIALMNPGIGIVNESDDGDAVMDTTADEADRPPASFDREMNIVDGSPEDDAFGLDLADGADPEESESFRRMLRRHRLDQKADDYVEVPENQSARDRFVKYKALQSFRKSVWDSAADLPPSYSRIFKFRDYQHSRKAALDLMESEENSVDCETYVSVVLADVPQKIMDCFNPALEIMVLFGLLRHENKISIHNFAFRKMTDYTGTIANKERLFVQIGFRRYSCRPVLSEHNLRSDKFKMVRVIPDHLFSVGTVFAHVTYTPAPVLVFKRSETTGETVLAASGSLLSVDPSRIILRKIVLTGHICRAHKRKAIVRFMFNTPEDVNWFKPVEMVTTSGKRGVIRQSVGTHGYMKCLFQDFVQQNEVALMNLYKRVFPRWDFQFVSSLDNK